MIKVKVHRSKQPAYVTNFFIYAHNEWANLRFLGDPSISLRQLEINLLKPYGATLAKFGVKEELRFNSKGDHILFMVKWA